MNQFRYEEKFLLSPKQYFLLKERVNKLFSLDSNTVDGAYKVSSIYFDDYQMTSVKQKEDGVKERYKYRIRYYQDNRSHLQLEKKLKDGLTSYKQKLSMNEEDFNQTMEGNYEFFRQSVDPLAKDFYLQLTSKLLKPVLEVVYEREAYLIPFNEVRITFDKNLRYRVLTTNSTRSITDYVVLEIKYNHFFPHHLKQLFEVDSPNKLSISKYVLCYYHSKQEEIEL